MYIQIRQVTAGRCNNQKQFMYFCEAKVCPATLVPLSTDSEAQLAPLHRGKVQVIETNGLIVTKLKLLDPRLQNQQQLKPVLWHYLSLQSKHVVRTGNILRFKDQLKSQLVISCCSHIFLLLKGKTAVCENQNISFSLKSGQVWYLDIC